MLAPRLIVILAGLWLATASAAHAAESSADACHRLATHPADAPSGVAFKDLDAPAALAACDAALAAAPDDARLRFQYARALLKAGRAVEARGEAERAAEQGHVTAHLLLAQIYDQGHGVTADPDRVIEHMRVVAEHGLAEAQFALAELLAADRRFGEAAPWYGKAADGGHPRARQRLAAALTKAANEGDAHAQATLGWAYQSGLAGAVDLAQAQTWYGKAAEQGDAYAARMLAVLATWQGDYGQAENVLRRAVADAERQSDKRDLGLLLGGLATVYEESGRIEEAAPLFAQALDVLKIDAQTADADALNVLADHALLEERRGRLREALVAFEKLRTIAAARFPAAEPLVALNVARVMTRLGNAAEAGPVFTRALAAIDKAGLRATPVAVRGLADHAAALARLGDLARAEATFRDASALAAQQHLDRHPLIVPASVDYARVLRERGKPEEARAVLRGAIASYGQRLDGDRALSAAAQAGERAALRESWIAALELLKDAPEESFAIVQLAAALSASTAVGQLAARTAAGSDALAELVRARQKAFDQREHLNREISGRFIAAGPGAPMPLADGAALDAQIAALDAALRARFPRYFELTTSAPLPLKDVQALLALGEAMLAYVFGEHDGYLLVVTASRADLRKLPGLGRAALEVKVRDLRRGLDPSQAMSASALPPFDGALAYELYERLIAPAADLLAGVTALSVVPDAALTSLPLHVLLTASPPASRAYRDYAWLARRYAIATVPSSGALRALRQLAGSRAPKKFAGFGAPSLDAGRVVTVAARGRAADLSSLPPLPETADELRELARALGADGRFFTGAAATERQLRALDLKAYRVLAFATHGLIAGELPGLPEPSLVLTPPREPGADDDGLLTASEVAQLTMDADWVVLSACNTAAPGGRPGADGLSGLARAFFMAGSRALLVSNWPVISDAAVQVTTRMLAAQRATPAVTRADALRQAMLAVLEDPSLPRYVQHPAAWAPFTVVGDGGAMHPLP